MDAAAGEVVAEFVGLAVNGAGLYAAAGEPNAVASWPSINVQLPASFQLR